ncbi:extracellular calcium-sensing receptor isoform X1 [Hydra vulgaris]|uniref:extracellular calcium-sensing receptor isoform X1 n=1 Tax=Hydra vulgaris TaxID=6087 RepID=UPI001F5FC268|nr:extracellular calcium-sensing receptor [Hydra vulgaris]
MKILQKFVNLFCVNLCLIFSELIKNATSINGYNKISNLYQSGDVLLGGLFSIYPSNNNNDFCIHSRSTFLSHNYQMVEAMIFAVNSINNDSSILPGIFLGYDIKDTCGTIDNSIRAVLNFSFIRKYFFANDMCHFDRVLQKTAFSNESSLTIAIIGPESSNIARSIADFAGLFKVPVISPSATSVLLGNRKRFKYFLRTVPSDAYLVKMIIDIIHKFGWNYIVLIVSNDEYGKAARLEFLKKVLSFTSKPICIAMDEIINDHDETAMLKIVSNLNKINKTNVIVFISSVKEARYFLNLCVGKLREFTWITTDTWIKETTILGKEKLLRGMLGISPLKPEIPDFFKQRLLLCKKSAVENCTFSDSFEIAPYKISSTINAVYAVAHALHNLLKCNNKFCQRSISEIDGEKLLAKLENVRFVLYNQTVSFDSDGDTSIQYYLWNYQKKKSGQFVFENIGIWHSKDSLRLNLFGEVKWNTKDDQHPISTCSSECKKGFRRHVLTYNSRCCWDCILCSGNTYVNSSNSSTCEKCPENYIASNDKSYCKPIITVYLKMTDYWAITLLCLTGLGNIFILLTLILYKVNKGSPVICSSNQGLCYISLIGASMFFTMPIYFIMKPTETKCKFMPFVVGLTLVTNIGTLLVKTNQVGWVLRRKMFYCRRYCCLSSVSQYLKIGMYIFIEVLICLYWELASINKRPNVVVVTLENNIEKAMMCSYATNIVGLILWFIYNIGLLIVCAAQALLARNDPSNNSEAKFIALTTITICISLTVYVPVYYGAVGYYRDLMASFLFVFMGFVEWLCLFGRKIFFALVRPEERSSTKTQSFILRNKASLQNFERINVSELSVKVRLKKRSRTSNDLTMI